MCVCGGGGGGGGINASSNGYYYYCCYFMISPGFVLSQPQSQANPQTSLNTTLPTPVHADNFQYCANDIQTGW